MAIAVPYTATSIVATEVVQQFNSWESKPNNRVGDHDLSAKVRRVEWRYCHSSGDISDFGATLANRLLSTHSWKAAHHHFILLFLDNGKMVYIDKHARRNILYTDNTNGLNKSEHWVYSTLHKQCTTTRSLGEFVAFAEQDRFLHYKLLENDCQDFAEAIYLWC